MYVLVNNPPPNFPDDIQLITEAAFPMGGGNPTIAWYCSWNTAQGCCGGPYRNTGIAPTVATAAFALSAPTSLISAAFPPTLAPLQLLEVTEITVHNPLSAGPASGPVNVFIVFFNGAGLSTTIMRCSLGGGHTLSYKASPGQNGEWKLFDTKAHLVNS